MKRITTGFVMSLLGSVLLLLQLLGVGVDAPYVTEVVGAVCAVLVVLGIIVSGGKNNKADSEGNDSDKTDCESEQDESGETESDESKNADDIRAEGESKAGD